MVAAFVAPHLVGATLRFVEAARGCQGIELAVVNCEPEDHRPSELRRGLAAHWRIDAALDAAQIAKAVQALGEHLAPVRRLLAVLEQLQVPVVQVLEALEIAGINVATARNFRDNAQMKSVLRAASDPRRSGRRCPAVHGFLPRGPFAVGQLRYPAADGPNHDPVPAGH